MTLTRLTLLLAAAASLASAAKLREGTELRLRFAQDISSKTATEGDPVDLILDEDVTVDGVVVARRGDKAVGSVSNAKRAGMMGRPGELNIRLEYLRAGDQKIRIRGTRGREGESRTGTAVVLTVLFGPIGLIKKGKEINVPRNTELKAYVSDDVELPALAR